MDNLHTIEVPGAGLVSEQQHAEHKASLNAPENKMVKGPKENKSSKQSGELPAKGEHGDPK